MAKQEPESDLESLRLTMGLWDVEEQPTEGTVDLSIFCDTPALPATLALDTQQEGGWGQVSDQ